MSQQKCLSIARNATVALVFWIFMIARSTDGKGPKPFWFIIINLTIGLSCALPAYLYANEGTEAA